MAFLAGCGDVVDATLDHCILTMDSLRNDVLLMSNQLRSAPFSQVELVYKQHFNC